MRSSSLFLSLLIHLLFLLALASWSSSLLKEVKKRPAIVEIPVELSYLEPPPAPKKREAQPPERKEKKPSPELQKKVVKKDRRKPLKPRPERRKRRKTVKRELPPKPHKVKEVKKAAEPEGEVKKEFPTSANKPLREVSGAPLPQKEEPEAKSKALPVSGEAQKPAPKPPQFNPEDYKRLVVAVLEKNKFYPPLARRMGIEGLVEVEITFNRAGEPVSVKVLNSPPGVLKRAAVKLIKKSEFPPLPVYYDKPTLTLKVGILYRLE
jgi:protein TonB